MSYAVSEHQNQFLPYLAYVLLTLLHILRRTSDRRSCRQLRILLKLFVLILITYQTRRKQKLVIDSSASQACILVFFSSTPLCNTGHCRTSHSAIETLEQATKKIMALPRAGFFIITLLRRIFWCQTRRASAGQKQ